MIKLEKDIIDILHDDREISFRYDLLNYNETKIGELTSLGGSLGLNSLAQIKRKGKFQFKENELRDVNWLNDKVRPVFILKNKNYGKAKKSYVAVPINIRYIRSSQKGGWFGSSDEVTSGVRVWSEIKAFSNGVNVAKNKDISHDYGSAQDDINKIVDDDLGTNCSILGSIGTPSVTPEEYVSVTIDLGQIRSDIDSILHYTIYAAGNYEQIPFKLEVSTDKQSWTTIYNTDISGTFEEPEGGRLFEVPKTYIAIEEVDNTEQFEFPLGIFMISSPSRMLRKKSIYRDVEAYDTSLVLLEDKFDTRYRVVANTNYITAITQIINSAGIWKVNIPFIDAKLKTDREFEIGTSKLEVVNYLLQEINYTSVWVDELGNFTANPYILPTDRVVEYSYKNDDMSIILPDTSIEEMDLFSVPNKWVVVATNPEIPPMVSRYENNSAGSPTSTLNRRRTIVDYREVDDIANQSILDGYVRRIAYEASNVFGKFIFSTALMPHHSYMDALFCEHTDLGVKNKYIETSWEMDLKVGGKMRHSARRVIQL